MCGGNHNTTGGGKIGWRIFLVKIGLIQVVWYQRSEMTLVFYLALIWLNLISVFCFRGIRFPTSTKLLSKRLRMCIDTKFKPIPRSGGNEKSDSDPSWRTAPSTIICIDTPNKILVKPEVITFDIATLIEPSQSVGRWYREALNTVCDMRVRLPRPALFTAAFNKAYSDM